MKMEEERSLVRPVETDTGPVAVMKSAKRAANQQTLEADEFCGSLCRFLTDRFIVRISSLPSVGLRGQICPKLLIAAKAITTSAERWIGKESGITGMLMNCRLWPPVRCSSTDVDVVKLGLLPRQQSAQEDILTAAPFQCFEMLSSLG